MLVCQNSWFLKKWIHLFAKLVNQRFSITYIQKPVKREILWMAWRHSQAHTNIFYVESRNSLWWASMWFSRILGSSQTLPGHTHLHRERQWQAGPATESAGPGAKWKCRASCSKRVKTFETATAEVWGASDCRSHARETGPHNENRHRVWQEALTWYDSRAVPGRWQVSGMICLEILGVQFTKKPKNKVPPHLARKFN